ncbi:MAG: hypothetical protein R3F11_18025 [Verrucomicrobiales bacterium]
MKIQRLKEVYWAAAIALAAANAELALADPAGKGLDYPGYLAAVRNASELAKAGNEFASQDHFAAALDQIVAADGSLAGEFRSRRKAVLMDSAVLRGRILQSARLALAEREQSRSERIVNAWARDYGAAAGFDCLEDEPIKGADDFLTAMVWRMRSARADLLDIQGRTIEAVALLERTLDEAKRIPARSQDSRYELGRTRIDLASRLHFLGYFPEAIRTFDAAIEARKSDGTPLGRRQLRRAKFNRLFSVAKIEGASAKIVEQARALAEEGRQDGDQADTRQMLSNLAKLEFRAGLADQARERLAKVAASETDRSELNKMYFDRISMVEDQEDTDENATDADFEAMLGRFRERGVLRGLPTAYREYGDFLGRADRVREAIPMVAEAAALTEQFGWDLHLPPLWARLAALHDHIGEHAAADAYWKRIDALVAKLSQSERGIPDIRRFWIGQMRLDWLIRNGRAEEARALLAELRQNFDASQIGDLEVAALKMVSVPEIPEPAPQPAASLVEVVKTAFAALEPAATRTYLEGAAAGEPAAKSRFSLLNPNDTAVAGQLRATGDRARLTRIPGGDVELVVGEGPAAAGAVSVALEVGAMERIAIDVSARGAGRCQLEWIERGAVRSSSSWIVEAEDGGAPLEVRATSASTGRRSPFYATPLFQEIRWADAVSGGIKFRLRCSEGTWLSYRLPDGQIIATDANGDGDFKDAGDMIAPGYDPDGDLIPEIPAASPGGSFPLEVFASVLEIDASEAAVSLVFEAWDGGDWRRLSQSLLEVSHAD